MLCAVSPFNSHQRLGAEPMMNETLGEINTREYPPEIGTYSPLVLTPTAPLLASSRFSPAVARHV